MFALLATIVFWWAAAQPIYGQCIDFETLPGASGEHDNETVSTQYEVDFGVSFQLLEHDTFDPIDANIGPRIAKVGAPRTAFAGPSGAFEECDAPLSTDDTPVAGQGVGCYFLTDDGALTPGVTYDLLVTYTPDPVQQASGHLLDIQPSEEAWKIIALDADKIEIVAPGNPIFINTVTPGTGDGVATPWMFDDLGQGIYFIVFRYVGDIPEGFAPGLAFDNFCPESLAGACCTVAGCSIQTQTDCEADGGVYQGDGTVCDVDTCEPPDVPATTSWGLLILGLGLLGGSAYALSRRVSRTG